MNIILLAIVVIFIALTGLALLLVGKPEEKKVSPVTPGLLEELDKLRKENQQLAEGSRLAEENAANIKQELERAKLWSKAQQEDLEKLKDDNLRIAEEMAVLKNHPVKESVTDSEVLQEKDREIAGLKTQYRELQEMKQGLEARIVMQRKESDLQGKMISMADSQEKDDRSKKEISDLLMKIRSREETLRQAQEDLQALKEENAKLSQELKEKAEGPWPLQLELSRVKEEAEGLSAELKKKEEAIAQLQNDLNTAKAATERMLDELQSREKAAPAEEPAAAVKKTVEPEEPPKSSPEDKDGLKKMLEVIEKEPQFKPKEDPAKRLLDKHKAIDIDKDKDNG